MDDRIVDWVSEFLSEWEGSRMLYTEAAEIIVSNIRTALSASAQGRQHLFPDAQALMKVSEIHEP